VANTELHSDSSIADKELSCVRWLKKEFQGTFANKAIMGAMTTKLAKMASVPVALSIRRRITK
jgi:hypothetical protein